MWRLHRDSKADLDRLEQWCASLKGKALDQTIIDKYRPFHARAKAGVQAIRPDNDLAAILSEGEQDWYRELFLQDFKDFVVSEHGKASTKRRVKAAKEIRTTVRMPRLNFSKSDWETSYRIRVFGAIRLAYPEMTESLPELRRSISRAELVNVQAGRPVDLLLLDLLRPDAVRRYSRLSGRARLLYRARID